MTPLPGGEMAGFASQAALRSKWGDLVDSGSTGIETSEVSQGFKNVVGWLKQVLGYVVSVEVILTLGI